MMTNNAGNEPIKTLRAQFPPKLSLINVSIFWNPQFFKRNVLSIVRRIRVENFIIVIHLVYQLIIWFITNSFTTLQYKRFAHIRFKLVQNSSRRKPRVASAFCDWPLWGLRLVDNTASLRWSVKTKPCCTTWSFFFFSAQLQSSADTKLEANTLSKKYKSLKTASN